MEIKEDNIARTPLQIWDYVGTIAIDFSNRIEDFKMMIRQRIVNNNIKDFEIVAFKFNDTLFKQEVVSVEIIVQEQGDSRLKSITTEIDKETLLSYFINVSIQLTDRFTFTNDKIDWKNIL